MRKYASLQRAKNNISDELPMTARMEIKEFVKRDVKNPFIVVGFPTVGLVGAIATRYLATSLSLELIGEILSPDLPPVTLISEGKVIPAYRVYAGNEVCGPDHKCDQLIVVTSDFPPPQNAIWPMAETILEWSSYVKSKLVVTLEGVVYQMHQPQPQVWGVATTEQGYKVLNEHKVKPLDQGLITGLSAAILSVARGKELDVLCLLTEAHKEIPDARAASQLITTIGRMTPRLKIDPEPLIKEAEEIENNMKDSLTKLETQTKRLPEAPSRMYA